MSSACNISSSGGVTSVSPGCQRCHRAMASGLWKLTYPDGREELKFLCASCGLSDLPQTKTQIRLVVSIGSNRPSTDCSNPLTLTGQVFRVGDAVAVEMTCTKCGFLTDVPYLKVPNARKFHRHTIPHTPSSDCKAESDLDGEASHSNLPSPVRRDEPVHAEPA